MKLYVVTMPDGSRWGVPPEIIAKDRAKYYADDPDSSYHQEYDLMMEYFDDSDFEFADWAKNNMNWADVMHAAIRLPNLETKVDWEEGWMNGDAEYPVEVGEAQA